MMEMYILSRHGVEWSCVSCIVYSGFCILIPGSKKFDFFFLFLEEEEMRGEEGRTAGLARLGYASLKSFLL